MDIHPGDAMDLERFGDVDPVFSNHVLHHLPNAMIPGYLRVMDSVAKRRWLVSDLRRSLWAYAGFQFLGRFFRNSFTFEDGKRSIRRSFVEREIAAYATSASLDADVEIRHVLPGRILVIGTKAVRQQVRDGNTLSRQGATTQKSSCLAIEALTDLVSVQEPPCPPTIRRTIAGPRPVLCSPAMQRTVPC